MDPVRSWIRTSDLWIRIREAQKHGSGPRSPTLPETKAQNAALYKSNVEKYLLFFYFLTTIFNCLNKKSCVLLVKKIKNILNANFDGSFT